MSTTPAATAAVSAATTAAASSSADSPPHATAGAMRAIVGDRYGSAEQLELRTVPRPVIEADEVLVEVRAAGVDRGVWHLVTGLPLVVRLAGYGLRGPKQPVPGLDLAGTVVEVGADVTTFAVGDEVYGIGSGAYAEYATAKASKLAHRPDSLEPEQAATIAISGATATQAVLDIGGAQPGQRVLVLGASGGVGSFAVQVAHNHGLHVTGVASGAKADHVTALGADVVLDYETDDFADEAPFDLIIDTGGRNRLSKLRRALTSRGTLVIVGGEGGGRITGGAGRQLRAMMLSLFVRQRLTTFVSDEDAEAWSSLRDLVADGTIVAPVDRRYELERAPIAIADLAAGRIRGKAVISVA